MDQDIIRLMEAYDEVTKKNIDGVPYETYNSYDRKPVKVISAYDVAEHAKIEVPENYQEGLPEWLRESNASEEYKQFQYKVMKWCELHNAYLFSHGKESSGYFPLPRGIEAAVKEGKDIVVYENLS